MHKKRSSGVAYNIAKFTGKIVRVSPVFHASCLQNCNAIFRSAASFSSMWRRACRSHTQTPCYPRAMLIEEVNDSNILWTPYIILWLRRPRGWGRIRPRRRASMG